MLKLVAWAQNIVSRLTLPDTCTQSGKVSSFRIMIVLWQTWQTLIEPCSRASKTPREGRYQRLGDRSMGRLEDSLLCPRYHYGPYSFPGLWNWYCRYGLIGVEGVTYGFIDLLEVCLFQRYHNRIDEIKDEYSWSGLPGALICQSCSWYRCSIYPSWWSYLMIVIVCMGENPYWLDELWGCSLEVFFFGYTYY